MQIFDLKKALALEQKYDQGLITRKLPNFLFQIVVIFSVLFAGYHYVTSGIGVPVDYWHMGFHNSRVR